MSSFPQYLRDHVSPTSLARSRTWCELTLPGPVSLWFPEGPRRLDISESGTTLRLGGPKGHQPGYAAAASVVIPRHPICRRLFLNGQLRHLLVHLERACCQP